MNHCGQRLQCLAEPHVVGKQGAESRVAQEREPADPLALVGTDHGCDRFYKFGFGQCGRSCE